MPSYNEAGNISKMMEELTQVQFPKIKEASMHLLVVDDNSPDGTGQLVRTYMKNHKNVHLLTGEKEGLGIAYVRGMRYAMKMLGADAILEMDADFQHPPRFVKDMVAAYLNGADYVIGSRYIKGGSIPKEWPIFRKAVSYFGNLFIRIVLLKPGIHDLTTGFRLTKVDGVLDKIKLEKLMELHRFAYKVDLLYQSIKDSEKVVEVPLEFAPRTQERSKFDTKEMVATFKVAVILGIKDKIRIIKFGIVGFVGYLVNAFFLYLFGKMGFVYILKWALSTELAIVSNFTWNNLWTFSEKKIEGINKIPGKFLQFNLTSAGALIIQTVVGTLADNLLGTTKYDQIILPFVVVFLVLPYNYFMYNAVIWKTWKFPGIGFLQKIFGKAQAN